MHTVALFFVLKLGHLRGYCLYVFRCIVGQTITSEVFLYLTLRDFSEDFVGAAYAIVIDNGIMIILIQKVVVVVLRG